MDRQDLVLLDSHAGLRARRQPSSFSLLCCGDLSLAASSGAGGGGFDGGGAAEILRRICNKGVFDSRSLIACCTVYFSLRRFPSNVSMRSPGSSPQTSAGDPEPTLRTVLCLSTRNPTFVNSGRCIRKAIVFTAGVSENDMTHSVDARKNKAVAQNSTWFVSIFPLVRLFALLWLALLASRSCVPGLFSRRAWSRPPRQFNISKTLHVASTYFVGSYIFGYASVRAELCMQSNHISTLCPIRCM
eukprot:6212692-Pleurochrysis_carterae.AAC.2